MEMKPKGDKEAGEDKKVDVLSDSREISIVRMLWKALSLNSEVGGN